MSQFSSRLLNSISVKQIAGGINRPTFYTENTTNFEKGEYVYIIGGIYDIDNQPRHERIGYRIIDINNNEITLDTEVKGNPKFVMEDDQPFGNGIYSNNTVLHIYVANSTDELDDYLSRVSMLQATNAIGSKFGNTPNQNPNLIIFYNMNFIVNGNPIPYNGLVDFIDNYLFNNDYLINIIGSDLDLSSMIPPNTTLNPERYAYIKSTILKKGYVYKYGVSNFEPDGIFTENYDFNVVIEYNNAYITKINYRNGVFNGTMNSGIYGSHRKVTSWNNANWNTGILLNSNWISGHMKSTKTSEISYRGYIEDGVATQRIIERDNGGYGFNIIDDSYIHDITIDKSNIRNSYVNGNTPHVMKDHELGNNIISNVNINKSKITNSFIKSSIINDSIIENSISENTYIENSNIVSSNVNKSVTIDSVYLTDKNNRILNISESNHSINSIDYKLFKLEVSRATYNSIINNKFFYIHGVRSNIDEKLLKMYDRKFIVGTYSDYINMMTSTGFIKEPVKISCSPSSRYDNLNSDIVYSIDIKIEKYTSNNLLDVPNINITVDSNGNPTGDIINYNEAYISFSSYNGAFENSTWASGNNIDFAHDNIINGDSSSYNITYIDNETISLTIGDIFYKERYDKKVNDVVYINGLRCNMTFIEEMVLNNNQGGYSLSSPILSNSSGDLEIEVISVDVNGIIEDFNIILDNNGNRNINDTITLTGGVEFIVTSVTDTEMPDFYIIDSITQNPSTFETIYTLKHTALPTVLVTPTLYYSDLTTNDNNHSKYNYLYSTKYNNSLINNGIHIRNYYKNSTFKSSIKLDKDLSVSTENRKLIVSETIFNGKGNTIENAIIMNSFYKYNGNEVWNNGIGYNLIWFDGILNNGYIINTRWENGIFNNGMFYMNKSTNYNSINYNHNSIDSYLLTSTLDISFNLEKNNRHSWQNGIFNNGEVSKSYFENGIFNNGYFYDSVMFNGHVINGTIGNDKIPYKETWLNNVVVDYAIVDYAYLKPMPILGITFPTIIWNNGIFNGGEFSAYDWGTSGEISVWNNGIFNGGEFSAYAAWNNGIFNGGKFTSYNDSPLWNYEPNYKYNDGTDDIDTNPYVINSDNYPWRNGIFNNGIIGTGYDTMNGNKNRSTQWFYGEFNGGIFRGKYWHNGVFSKGIFEGCIGNIKTDNNNLKDVIGGYNVDEMEKSNARDYVLLYSDNYIGNSNTLYGDVTDQIDTFYGLWNSGTFTNVKENYLPNKKIDARVDRFKVQEQQIKITAEFDNALFRSGTFDHSSAKFKNSIMLNGVFKSGHFLRSVMNPYAERCIPNVQYNTTPTGIVPELTFDGTNLNSVGLVSVPTVTYPTIHKIEHMVENIWHNGTFENSEIYATEWKEGIYLYGTSFGINWRNGMCNYMNAYNINWWNGVWRNGNWYGSFMIYDGTPLNGFEREIIDYINDTLSENNQSEHDMIHIWNVFEQTEQSPMIDVGFGTIVQESFQAIDGGLSTI